MILDCPGFVLERIRPCSTRVGVAGYILAKIAGAAGPATVRMHSTLGVNTFDPRIVMENS